MAVTTRRQWRRSQTAATSKAKPTASKIPDKEEEPDNKKTTSTETKKKHIPGVGFFLMLNIVAWWALETFWGQQYTSGEVVFGLSGGQFFGVMNPIAVGWAAFWLHFVKHNSILNAGGIPSPLPGILPIELIFGYAYVFSPIADELVQNIPFWQLHAAVAIRMMMEIPLMIDNWNGKGAVFMISPFEKSRAPYKLYGTTFTRGANVDGTIGLLGLVLAFLEYNHGPLPTWLVLSYHLVTALTMAIAHSLLTGHMDRPNLLSIRTSGQPDSLVSTQGYFSFPFYLMQVPGDQGCDMVLVIAIRKALFP